MGNHSRFTSRASGQAGFSLVEMLMTAFILAVGILGLTMLQVMSMKASRGGRSLTTAVLVGEQLMDRVEMQGRLSYLNRTDTTVKNRSNADFTPANLKYIAQAGPFSDYFDVNGTSVATKTDPNKFYEVTTTRADAAVSVDSVISDYTIQIQFWDQVDQANAPIPRTVTLTRRIIHG